MRSLLLALLCALAAACVHAPDTRPTLTVAIEHGESAVGRPIRSCHPYRPSDGGAMRALLCLLLALCGACVAPDVRSAASLDPRPPARVAVDHSQSEVGLATGYDGFVAAGVAILASDPSHRWSVTRGAHDVEVRHATDAQLAAMGPTTEGLDTDDEDAVYVAPARIAGPEAFALVVAHELGHWAGAQHICRWRGELPDATHPHEQCSPVGYGRAVLNPYVHYREDRVECAPDDGACIARDLTTDALTDLDRLELARALGRRGGR